MTQEHSVHNYSSEEIESSVVREPDVELELSTKKGLRVVSDEELARCMTLEESERLITEKIYKFYHPEA